MKLYIPVTVFLYVAVNFLLLTATAKMLKCSVGWIRIITGSVISGMYVLLCLLFPASIIGSVPIYLLSVICASLLAYGLSRKGFVASAAFSFLYIALGGISVKNAGLLSLLFGTAGIFVVCYIVLNSDSGELIPVQLFHKGQCISLFALKDTGNTLTDPLTGKPVLIVDAQTSKALTGLTEKQLRSPVDSVGLIPGMRLIPYKTVGQAGQFLLAMRVDKIKIGSRQESALVAFSPEQLSVSYQALTGGNL